MHHDPMGAARWALRLAISATLTAATFNVAAHDYWIDRTADAYVLYQGHAYSAHKGEERVPYDPGIVKRVLCAGAEGGSITTLEPARQYPMRVAAKCSAVIFETNASYWSQTLTDTVQKPKSEVRGALRGWRAEETVKRIDSWLPSLTKPLSDGLELVPLDDPLKLKPGDKLRVLATWRGEPRAGVVLAYAGDARGVTGADGQGNLRIRSVGLQTLSASLEEPLRDPQADKAVRGTILQFEIAK